MGCAGADGRRGPWWRPPAAPRPPVGRMSPVPSQRPERLAWLSPRRTPGPASQRPPRRAPGAAPSCAEGGAQHPGRCLHVALSGEFSLQRHRIGGRQRWLFSECLRATGTVGHVLPQFPPAALSKHRWPASWRSPQGCPQHDHPQLTVTLGQGLLRSPLQQNRVSTRPQAHSRHPCESGCTPRAWGGTPRTTNPFHQGSE